MLKIEIKSWVGSILFVHESENNSIRKTVEAAIAAGANLTDADLTDADLTDADLTDADLTGATLRDADLTDANLTYATLRGANLTGANLTDADLTDADLRGANLTGANLTDANLTDADLREIKNDFWEILLHAQREVAGLRAALVDGKVDGSTYTGQCACLVGTIANVAGCAYSNLNGIVPNSGRPAERWFLAIRKGDTPENSAVAKITVDWIDDFLSLLPTVTPAL